MRRILAIALFCSSCSFTHGAQPPDTSGSGSDAGVAGRKQMEVVAGAGRVTAGTITIDLEVGHAVPIKKSTAGTITISGAAVVIP
jgi:hypothetical protein